MELIDALLWGQIGWLDADRARSRSCKVIFWNFFFLDSVSNKIISSTQAEMKSFPRWLIQRSNPYCVDSDSNETRSALAESLRSNAYEKNCQKFNRLRQRENSFSVDWGGGGGYLPLMKNQRKRKWTTYETHATSPNNCKERIFAVPRPTQLVAAKPSTWAKT